MKKSACRSLLTGLHPKTKSRVLHLRPRSAAHTVWAQNTRSSYHDAIVTDLFDEGVAGTVVGDGQAERWSVLVNLDESRVSFDVREEEVVEADLAAKEAGHVDFVCVQRAVQDLQRPAGVIIGC